VAGGHVFTAVCAAREEEEINANETNQILTWLSGGDLRSDGMANEAAQVVLDSPEIFCDLMAGLKQPDDVVRARTADALEKIARQRPDLLIEHLKQMIALAETERVPAVKLHLAMIFGHLAVYEEMVGQLITVLNNLLEDESVFTRSWAIASLCILGRKYPGENQRILNRIAQLQSDPSVAIRSRTAKAIALLTNPEKQFPKGWIKSVHLPDMPIVR
jgi:HEAT repeat protein